MSKIFRSEECITQYKVLVCNIIISYIKVKFIATKLMLHIYNLTSADICKNYKKLRSENLHKSAHLNTVEDILFDLKYNLLNNSKDTCGLTTPG